MSAVVSESVFFSTLKPNTSVTTYALPSDIQLDNGGTMSDEVSRHRRVQQQIQMRLAEKSTLPRQNGSSSHYAMSDYGGSSTMKYSTYSPNFSSKSSYLFTGSKTMGPRVAQRQDYSSRSAAPDLSQLQRMSVGGGGGFYHEDTLMGKYQGSMRQHNRMDQDTVSVHSFRNVPMGNSYLIDDSDAGSIISERDATLNSHYTQSANGFTGQVMQGRTLGQQSMRGTITRSGGMMGGGSEVMQHQQSFKGPAHRTISRLTSRNRTSMGSLSVNQMVSSGINFGGGDRVDHGFIASTLSGSQSNLMMQRQTTLPRSMSIRSVHSVGRGADILPMDMTERFATSGFEGLEMETAVSYLKETDTDLQTMGAAFIQHQCYSKNEAKEEVRELGGVTALVSLFCSENIEVQRYATGAVRNLIFENMENKKALVQGKGIPELIKALKATEDEELGKNITGILWNLSSRDSLKQALVDMTLSELTEKVLIPASIKDGDIEYDFEDLMSPSKAEIFTNTTGCIRNLSSADEKARGKIRETKGLVAALVEYIKNALKYHKSEEKGTENAMCILRNLSYQLYSELPPSHKNRLGLEKRYRESENKNEVVGCFTPQSRKAKSKEKTNAATFKEVKKTPTELDWLYHPNILNVYHEVLESCEINATTREAAIGALQNITAGDNAWVPVLVTRIVEVEKMLPTLFDLLRTDRDKELRSLTGLLRNVCRHVTDKDAFARKSIRHLLEKLPEDPNAKTPGDDVVVNICGILNHLVTKSIQAAKEIVHYKGLTKLMPIKNNDNTSTTKLQTAKAAATVISNMYHYKKLRKEYAEEGFSDKADFVDNLNI